LAVWATHAIGFELRSVEAVTRPNRLERVDDPCEPQLRSVLVRADQAATTEAQEDAVAELFNYFDDSAGFATGDPYTVYESGPRDSNRQIEVFFGPDGRLIPACDESYSEIQPCLEEGNVSFDSGLDATINRLFQVGMTIVGFAIGLRLLIWVLGRLTARRRAASTAPHV
jgi:hypothetical protein